MVATGVGLLFFLADIDGWPHYLRNPDTQGPQHFVPTMTKVTAVYKLNEKTGIYETINIYPDARE